MASLANAGLGIVVTSTEEVHHPDPEHGKLPPQPILLVATSDGALRLFTFASLKRSAGSITHAAYSYEDAPYPAVLQAPAQVSSLRVPPFWGYKNLRFIKKIVHPTCCL